MLLRTAELPIRAVFSRQELDSNWLRLRGILNRLRRDPFALDGGFDKEGHYTGSYSPNDDCFRKGGEVSGRPISKIRLAEWFQGYLRDLAIAGADLRSNLFRSTSHQEVLNALRNETIEDGSVIQVWLDRQALDFAFPWHFLYDGTVDPKIRAEERADPNNFWGYRLEIEQVADCVETNSRGMSNGVVDVANRIRVRAGSYPFMQTKTNLQFFTDLSKLIGDRLDYQVWTESKDWKAFLPKCDAHLIYFYTHGHTALPATQAGQDLRRLSQDVLEALKLAEETAPAADGSETDQTDEVRAALSRLRQAFEFLDAEGLWDVHHIRLTTGHLLMSDLRSLKLTGSAQPLVVLNMCESAQVFPSLSDGMVNVFLARGAIGVIGTEVSIPPQFGDIFGRRLLKGLAEGRRISRVLYDLRRDFIDKQNLLGFVYTYYGDASVRITPPLTQADAIA